MSDSVELLSLPELPAMLPQPNAGAIGDTVQWYTSDQMRAYAQEAVRLAALRTQVPTNVGDWRIDTSAGGPILVYQNCSVIESDQAYYVLQLIAKDAAAPAAPQSGEERARKLYEPDDYEDAFKTAKQSTQANRLPVSWADFWISKGNLQLAHDYATFELANQWLDANITALAAKPSSEACLGGITVNENSYLPNDVLVATSGDTTTVFKITAGGEALEYCNYFADGPQGYFFSKSPASAESLISAAGFDRDDWTITELSQFEQPQPDSRGGG